MRSTIRIYLSELLFALIVLFSLLLATRIEASGSKPELIHVALEQFGNLSPAEEVLFKKVPQGLGMVVTVSSEGGYTAIENRTNLLIKAERLAWLCTNPKAQSYITRKGIYIKGCYIDGLLDLQFAEISHPLIFEKCSFPDGVNFTDANLSYVDFSDCTVDSFVGNNASFSGGLHLRRGFRSNRGVALMYANISDVLDCEGGCFANNNDVALALNGVNINGALFMRKGFRAEGEVHLVGAKIRDVVDCSEGSFLNEKGYAITAERLHVQGDVVFYDSTIKGKVYLTKALIEKQLIWRGTPAEENVILDLRYSKIGNIWDEVASWPAQGHLFIQGLEYDSFHNEPFIPVKERIKWLELQPSIPFPAQSYEHLSKVLASGGYHEEANTVQSHKARNEISLMPFHKRWLCHALLWPIGYGYKPLRLLWFIIPFLIFSSGLFRRSQKDGLIVASSDNLDKFRPFLYALDLFVPVVDLRVEKNWHLALPRHNDQKKQLLKRFLPVFHSTYIITGWIMTTLLVLGLSGLIRV